MTSLPVPNMSSEPGIAAQRTALGAVESVHNTTLVLPVKHGSVTTAAPALRMTCPAQTPVLIDIPPIGPQVVTLVGVVGGGGGN
ncbi:MAG TPA: hypothetical protein VIX59_09370 [Candidatus Binataceae bacterium]